MLSLNPLAISWPYLFSVLLSLASNEIIWQVGCKGREPAGYYSELEPPLANHTWLNNSRRSYLLIRLFLAWLIWYWVWLRKKDFPLILFWGPLRSGPLYRVRMNGTNLFSVWMSTGSSAPSNVVIRQCGHSSFLLTDLFKRTNSRSQEVSRWNDELQHEDFRSNFYGFFFVRPRPFVRRQAFIIHTYHQLSRSECGPFLTGNGESWPERT